MIDSVVDLVEEHVDLECSQLSESIVERWNCLVHHYWLMILVTIRMGFSILSRSTSSSILNVSISWEERNRELSVDINRIMNSNKSPRSVMNLFKIETLSVFRGTCLDYNCLNKSPRSVWRTKFFAKRINTDLLRTVRVCSILHLVKSPRSLTNWIWNRLGWLGTFCLSNNFTFWLSNKLSFPFVFQWDL